MGDFLCFYLSMMFINNMLSFWVNENELQSVLDSYNDKLLFMSKKKLRVLNFTWLQSCNTACHLKLSWTWLRFHLAGARS